MPNGVDPVERFRTRVRIGDVPWETVDLEDEFYETVLREDCVGDAEGRPVTRRSLLASVLREDCERLRATIAEGESPDPALLERLAAIETATPELPAERLRAALDELSRVSSSMTGAEQSHEDRRRLARAVTAAADAAGVGPVTADGERLEGGR